MERREEGTAPASEPENSERKKQVASSGASAGLLRAPPGEDGAGTSTKLENNGTNKEEEATSSRSGGKMMAFEIEQEEEHPTEAEPSSSTRRLVYPMEAGSAIGDSYSEEDDDELELDRSNDDMEELLPAASSDAAAADDDEVVVGDGAEDECRRGYDDDMSGRGGCDATSSRASSSNRSGGSRNKKKSSSSRGGSRRKKKKPTSKEKVVTFTSYYLRSFLSRCCFCDSHESCCGCMMRLRRDRDDGIDSADESESGLQRQRLRRRTKVGNVTVFVPYPFFRRTNGWGVIGPHWFGPACVLGLLAFATEHFVRVSLERVGIGTACTCVAFALTAAYFLCSASFRDPGIVALQQQQSNRCVEDGEEGDDHMPPPPSREHRWCDACQLYQPPDGAHCPDCDVCVAGFDHHCVWMGTCIGQNNFKPFLRFNQTWLLYLIYSILWVSVIGPRMFHESASDEDGPGVEQHQEAATANATLVGSESP